MLGTEDEVWLFGFSCGGYIVRAVAGLLKFLGAFESASTDARTFDEEYQMALK